MAEKTNLKQLRKRIRDARNQIPVSYARQASYKFSERIAVLETYQAANRVGGFLPFDGEADPLPLMDRAVQEGKSVFVPVIIGKSRPLKFVPWSRQSKMRENRYGIKEPQHQASELVDASELEFVATPLVAFDERCHRIGVGGGFYDRTFAFTHDDKSGTTLVGLAYELQKVDRINPETHDVRLDAVVTELATYSSQ